MKFKFIEKLKQLSNMRQRNPQEWGEVFHDPVAKETQWHPVKRGGASFGTHKLLDDPQFPERLEFKPTLGYKLFCGLFTVIGLSLIVGFSISMLKAKHPDMGMLFPIVFGLIFATVGIAIFKFGGKSRVFDHDAGFFWIGKRDFRELNYREIDDPKKSPVKLDRIHALQLISERCSSKNGSYLSYELNLVLDDGSRINVVDHGNLKLIRNDAEKLSEFLDVPIWDAIDG